MEHRWPLTRYVSRKSVLVVLSVLLWPMASAWSQTGVDPKEITALMERVERIDAAVERAAYQRSQLREWSAAVSVAKSRAESCILAAGSDLAKIEQDLAVLGVPVSGEPAEVTNKRTQLLIEQAVLENNRARCRLLVLRADEVAQVVSAAQASVLRAELLAKGPNIFILMQEVWRTRADWGGTVRQTVQKRIGLERLSGSKYLLLVLSVIAAGGTALWVRTRIRRRVSKMRRDATLSSGFGRALQTSLAHYSLVLFSSMALALATHAVLGPGEPTPLLANLVYGLPIYIVGLTAIHAFLAPFEPAQQFLKVADVPARALARRLKVLFSLSFVGYLAVSTLWVQELAQSVLLLARAIFLLVLILNLIWALWLLGAFSVFARMRWVRMGLLFVLAGSFIAELLGYRNLSFLTLRAVIGTLVAVGLFLLIDRLAREFLDSIARGRRAVHRRLRQILGLKSGDKIPGLIWIRASVSALLWLGFALVVLRIWGLSDAALHQVENYFVEGFQIGSLRVVPARILMAIVSFALLYLVAGWFRGRLERKWLKNAPLERGTREAIVTIGGYFGVGVAVLVAFGIAGLEFTNLAIIAGALSVGIGFGLQNIVNNFVSGLILLFERPIKTGDWIVVGATEGYVKRIRIRSTQIQTFDRADVIVPNSELISGQVTNWMLYDPRGRIRVPIGVAYGSDTQKVKEILLGVAASHPNVIKDEPEWAPTVLFQGFGDSSLNFELRCYVVNIDDRFRVTSDMNFAIDAAFRAQGIEIPFPQRDVHVRDLPRRAGDALGKEDGAS